MKLETLISKLMGIVIVGFMISMLIIVNGKKKWKVNIIIALAFSVGIYIIFSKLLGISLPQIPYLYI